MVARVLVLLAAASILLGTSASAVAKEGVQATLETTIPLRAPAGKTVRVIWRLRTPSASGRARPFSAGGIFIRFVSRTEAGRTEAYGREIAAGRYATTVRIPRGGLGRIEIGLEGVSCAPTGCRRDDHLFRITNDPTRRP